ncbi:hypothetical protein SERLADRAFT_458463 [Serpula lacrymans var. lacrymans S7.9]|uniref:Uncharacterized protein n=1 Tax=Serpula lacrymans var. lacrymans (strain S7.9) TaxID=578457 RepID=F8NJG3_SERL9|nr:uncharacterized protein SERLADRAFT_458463 [Serpula lacrymans var. lacrymans S7.9]EGO30013.1 hypothetical protein SERLADRAFT_458463 [Serpula lacrymans var. lacrymans S7.9]
MPRDGTRDPRVNGITSNLPEDLPPNDPPNPGQRLSNPGITQSSAGITSRARIPATTATVTVNGHSTSALRPSPATLSDSVPTVLHFGPSTNPSDILEGLDEFIDQTFLRQDGEVNFERDFGQWFNPDDEELHVTR